MGDFLIRLRAAPGIDAIKALRGMLKAAWRHHKLRCISIIEEKREAPTRKPKETLKQTTRLKEKQYEHVKTKRNP
jgi:hypothetical protein